MTLLESIKKLVDNVSITDRQEENIKNSLSNLESHLKDEESNLYVNECFTNGSWERDTIIRPLNDVDLFAVLDFEEWKDEYGNKPNPQSVLTKIKNYLNKQNDYKDKVKQDRPCVTIHLSDKDFDVLPSFEILGGGYYIPNYDLESWTTSYPKMLTKDLDDTHRVRDYKLKQIIRVVKYWNRDFNTKTIPSYHIEEIAINIFKINNFTNFEEGIRKWFNNVEYNMLSSKFKSNDEYETSLIKVKKVKDKLNEAYKFYSEKNEVEAKKIWKEVFGKEFPTVDEDEAKNISKSLTEGTLKYSSIAGISTSVGSSLSASKGFYGDEVL
ncbi:MAG TPA: hypothetical protein VK179_16365 [Bacteroidales bacterium]|nr:hypothetical protein [Bacteroidales bacterium]